MLVLYTIWQYTRARAITKVAGAHEHDMQGAMLIVKKTWYSPRCSSGSSRR